MILPPGFAGSFLDAVDGLSIPGGPDIHPRLSGHEAHTMPGPTEMERDPVELALVDRLGEGLEAVAWLPDGERRERAVAGPVA